MQMRAQFVCLLMRLTVTLSTAGAWLRLADLQLNFPPSPIGENDNVDKQLRAQEVKNGRG